MTLEKLAQRLEGLQRGNAENAQRLETLERENTELRHKVATLEGSGRHRDELAEKRGSERRQDGEAVSALEGQLSRRSLLSKAGAAAVAAVAAGTLLNARPAKAHELGPAIGAEAIDTHWLDAVSHDPGAAVTARSTGLGSTVLASNEGSGPGVLGRNVSSLGGNGVEGEGSGHRGVGVLGKNQTGSGYEAFGVMGQTDDAVGVMGIGRIGVVGESTFGGHGAVYGHHTGSSGYGVVGDGTGSGGAGVLGRNSVGYGGQFEGGKAQLKLKPAGNAGKPSGSHSKGEIYMDSAGALFVCTKGGTPGTWRKVSTTAVS